MSGKEDSFKNTGKSQSIPADKSDFYCQLSQAATAGGFLLGQRGNNRRASLSCGEA